MDTSAYIGEIVSGFFYCFAGLRLFSLSRRTGHLPETLIATSFLLWTLAYAIWDIPYAFVDSEESVPAIYSYGSLIALASGNVVFACFIRAVFRPKADWAKGLVAAVAVCNLVGVAGAAWIGDWEGTNPLANPWYWLEFLGSLVPTAWMTTEGFYQYFKSRKQLKFGFCEPMDCNRFLLWGVSGGLWATLELIVAASDIVYAFTGQWSEALGLGIAFFEVIPVAMVMFVFFPPAFYCRWVEGGGKPASA